MDEFIKALDDMSNQIDELIENEYIKSNSEENFYKQAIIRGRIKGLNAAQNIIMREGRRQLNGGRLTKGKGNNSNPMREEMWDDIDRELEGGK